MPFVKAKSQKHDYDVIVVGSGAAGGQSAYTLCMDGAKVLMLEAGRRYNPATETPMFQTPDLAPLAGVGTPQKPFGFYDATVDGGWEVPGEPYVRTSDEPAGRFDWWRARMLGGRTNHWGRISLRNGPYDFKPHSRDGFGFDWPIAYEDVAPYYDKVELLIGVYGSNEGLENTPDSPPGCLLPPPRPLVSDLLMAQRAKRLGIAAIPGHKAVLTRPLDFRSSPARLHPGNVTAQSILAEDMRARAPCLWATPCGRGCSIRANYQSTTVHLPPALASGNLDITTDAMVYEVRLGRDGRANGVSFIDRTTGKPRHGTGAGMEWLTGGSYGVKLKEDVRRYYGSFVHFDGRGEMIPNEHSYCEIDPSVKDKWGIPVLRFHWQWSEHELRQAAHMQRTFAEIVDSMGGRMQGPVQSDGAKAIAPGGSIIHEVGGAIMGSDPKTSVTNRWCQTWDVPNLFVTDGAVFASNADKNPTLTIMALAWRAADHILERMRRKEL